jgi:hypothetical protein
MEQPQRSIVREPDEALAPAVFLYLWGVVAIFAALVAWVYWFRGYA